MDIHRIPWMRSSVQVSSQLRRKLEARKEHPRQSYEEVIAAALDAKSSPMRTPGRLPANVRTAIEELAAKLRATYKDRLVRLVLYGSHARGDARPDSDVDVLVVLTGSLDRGAEITRIVDVTYDILLRSGVHLSALPMSEEDFLTRATPLLMNVRREGIPL